MCWLTIRVQASCIFSAHHIVIVLLGKFNMSESSLVTTACAQDHFATDLKWKVADPEAPHESSEESHDPHHDEADLVVPKNQESGKKEMWAALAQLPTMMAAL
jgi:hypothetical protein